MGRAFATNDIIDVHVKNLQGDVLGRIVDLIVDSEGGLLWLFFLMVDFGD